MSDDREVYPNAVSNEDSTRFYRSRNEMFSKKELSLELRDVVESSLKDGKFVAVTLRHITNWKTGDYFRPFITDVLHIEDTLTKRMFEDAYVAGPDTDDSMDFTLVVIYHKDKDTLCSAWEESLAEKEKADKIICDEFGYPY